MNLCATNYQGAGRHLNAGPGIDSYHRPSADVLTPVRRTNYINRISDSLSGSAKCVFAPALSRLIRQKQHTDWTCEIHDLVQ